jgi:hypothetical protein
MCFDMFESEYESYPCECGDTAVPLDESRAAITSKFRRVSALVDLWGAIAAAQPHNAARYV